MADVRYSSGVFVRHIKDESIVWCPLTGSCVETEKAGMLLEKIRFGRCNLNELDKRERELIVRLRKEGLVVNNDGTFIGDCDDGEAEDDSKMELRRDNDSEYSSFGGFCIRHNIAADLHLDLTDACTERCIHCYVPKGQNHFLERELAEKAIREFREAEGVSVHITGGECMLHPDFEHICRFCKSLNVNVIIYSNLTCCDDARIEFLREIDPQFVNVSLYSMNPNEHDAITKVVGSWDRTMNAILACEQANVRCRIATPLLKINQGAFPQLKQFADAHHMHFITSMDIVAQSDHNCENLASACSAGELKCVVQTNKEIFEQDWDGRMPGMDAKVCDIGIGRLYLNSRGNYYPCDSMHDYVLGNVCEHTFAEIWNGEKLNYLRGLKNCDFGACANCDKRPWCKVCPAANYNATRDLFTHSTGQCELARVVQDVYGRN